MILRRGTGASSGWWGVGGARGPSVVRGSSRGVPGRGQFPVPVALLGTRCYRSRTPFPDRGAWGRSRRPLLPEGRGCGDGKVPPAGSAEPGGSGERLQPPSERSGSVPVPPLQPDPVPAAGPGARPLPAAPRAAPRAAPSPGALVGGREGQPGAAPSCWGCRGCRALARSHGAG